MGAPLDETDLGIDEPVQRAGGSGGGWDESKHPRGKGGEFAPIGEYVAAGMKDYEAGDLHLGDLKRDLEKHEAALAAIAAKTARLKALASGIQKKHGKDAPDYYAPPDAEDALHNPHEIATFDKAPKYHDEEPLNGVPFTPVEPEYWEHTKDVDVGEPPMKKVPGLEPASGLIIREPDGRVWMVEPANHYGDTKHTFPKGKAEPDLTLQQNALKEAAEEAGLQARITGYLGDANRTTSRTRYYLAERTGGQPWDAHWESARVKLVPLNKAKALLNRTSDHKVIDALTARDAGKPGVLKDDPPPPSKLWSTPPGFSAPGGSDAFGGGGGSKKAPAAPESFRDEDDAPPTPKKSAWAPKPHAAPPTATKSSAAGGGGGSSSSSSKKGLSDLMLPDWLKDWKGGGEHRAAPPPIVPAIDAPSVADASAAREIVASVPEALRPTLRAALREVREGLDAQGHMHGPDGKFEEKDGAAGSGGASADTYVPHPKRDPRLPKPGTVLKKTGPDGKIHEITVGETDATGKTDFVWKAPDGTEKHYASLSPIAKEITGKVWNGFQYFSLGAKPKVAAPAAPAAGTGGGIKLDDDYVATDGVEAKPAAAPAAPVAGAATPAPASPPSAPSSDKPGAAHPAVAYLKTILGHGAMGAAKAGSVNQAIAKIEADPSSALQVLSGLKAIWSTSTSIGKALQIAKDAGPNWKAPAVGASTTPAAASTPAPAPPDPHQASTAALQKALSEYSAYKEAHGKFAKAGNYYAAVAKALAQHPDQAKAMGMLDSHIAAHPKADNLASLKSKSAPAVATELYPMKTMALQKALAEYAAYKISMPSSLATKESKALFVKLKDAVDAHPDKAKVAALIDAEIAKLPDSASAKQATSNMLSTLKSAAFSSVPKAPTPAPAQPVPRAPKAAPPPAAPPAAPAPTTIAPTPAPIPDGTGKTVEHVAPGLKKITVIPEAKFDPAALKALPKPDFMNWGGSGKSGPSSSAHFNKANQDAVDAIQTAAMTGNIEAIKSLKLENVSKETGAKLGTSTSPLDHPSVHVKGYAQQMIGAIQEQLTPTQHVFYELEGEHPLKAISAGVKALKGPALQSHIAAGKTIAKYADLGKIPPLAPNVYSTLFPKAATQQETLAKFQQMSKEAAPKLTSSMKSAIQDLKNGSNNSLVWKGNEDGQINMASKAIHEHGFYVPPDAVIHRKMKVIGTGLQQLLGSEGHVLQEMGWSHSSPKDDVWSGNVHLRLRAAPGVKALYVGPGSGISSSHGSEYESGLPAHTRLWVQKVTKHADGNGGTIDAIILPHEDSK